MQTAKSTGALLIATLSSAYCAGAAAQSGKVIYGVADAYVGRIKGSARASQVNNGGQYASRLGFRGREDLGEGMYAHYTLEMGLNLDTGAIPLGGGFGRQAFVGLGGKWGSVDLGLQYTPMFFNLARTGTFGLNNDWAPILVISRTDSQGPAVTAHAPPLRVANMVRYRYGAEGRTTGVKLDAAFAMGERSAAIGDVTGFAIGYQASEYFVGLSTQRAHTGTGAAAAGSTYAHALSAYRKHGAFKLNFNYVVTGSTVAGSRDASHLIGGVEYRMGPHALLLEVVRRDVRDSPNDAIISAMGYDYSLSKRTALYGRVLQIANKARAAVGMATAAVTANSGNDVRGLAIGIRHNF